MGAINPIAFLTLLDMFKVTTISQITSQVPGQPVSPLSITQIKRQYPIPQLR